MQVNETQRVGGQKRVQRAKTTKTREGERPGDRKNKGSSERDEERPVGPWSQASQESVM